MQYRTSVSSVLIYVFARHPLAFQSIKKALAADGHEIRPYNPNMREVVAPGWILILDTHSTEKWLMLASDCRRRGGRSIIISEETPQTTEEELRLVYLGIAGIIDSECIDTNLPKAVEMVCQGGLWIRHNTLAEYLRRTGSCDESDRFTIREEQIILFLTKKFSNKEIAISLGISERTVKFHISNIFQKLNVENRRELLQPIFESNKKKQFEKFDSCA